MLDKTGMVLGVVGDQVYRVSPSIELARGDLLFLHTDGVDEAMSPDRRTFGMDRLQQSLQDLREQSADDVLAGLEQDLRRHTGSDALEDDFTMIAVKLT